ncbi:MAG: MerR family transcriptional regulator [Acidimicrobiales bacterium]|nr:MerR family transcriptional regulator [Acidimicrobiales bacterium]
MAVLLPIGDFSKMTHLSVKTLRHYHEVGVLEPARIDTSSGYRFYDPSQVPTAQVIRRFRDLGMPLDDVRAMLQAPSVDVRNKVITQHLERMELQLQQTQEAVGSLRTLLEHPPPRLPVEYRSVPRTRALGIAEVVPFSEVGEWGLAAFLELLEVLQLHGTAPAGPPGALWSSEFFEEGQGDVVAFVPVTTELEAGRRARMMDIPAAELAVALHRGPLRDLDQTYGALGTYVTEQEVATLGPIREYYLVTPFDTPDETEHRTEVCWPVFHTTPG